MAETCEKPRGEMTLKSSKKKKRKKKPVYDPCPGSFQGARVGGEGKGRKK